MPTSLADLPYDIWLNIASFIPSKTLRDLYSVNRVLFNIALDERYRLAQIAHPEHRWTQECLKYLNNDPFRAGKVRALRLRVGPLGRIVPKGDQPDWKEKLKEGVHMKSGRRGKKEEAELRLTLESLLQIIRSLSNVNKCDLEYAPQEDSLKSFMAAIPFVLAGWEAFSTNLRTLRLSVPVETLAMVLPNDLKLDKLEELDIEIFMIYRSTDPLAIMTSTLVPFINNHRNTLQSFSFRTPQHFHLSVVYKQLLHMPHLRELNVSQGYVSTLQTDTSGFHQFLSAHADNLHSFGLLFYALGADYVRDPEMEDWFEQPCLNVSLPQLTHLDFGLHEFPNTFGARIHIYLKQFKASLRSLTLRVNLKKTDIDSVLEHLGPASKLRVLDITMETLTPHVLDALSSKLPNLQELDITIEEFSDEWDTTNIPNARSFCSEMSSRSYMNWKLQHLTMSSNPFSAESKKVCLIAVLKSLPSLNTLNGKLRDVCLSRYIDEVSRSSSASSVSASDSLPSLPSVSSSSDQSV